MLFRSVQMARVERVLAQSICNQLRPTTTAFGLLTVPSVLSKLLRLRFMTDSNPTLSARFLHLLRHSEFFLQSFPISATETQVLPGLKDNLCIALGIYLEAAHAR